MTMKHGFTIGMAMGFVFGLGCAAGATLIPPARAQSTAPRWEYLEIEHGWDGGRWANEAGAEGWELVQVGNATQFNHLYFRRPR